MNNRFKKWFLDQCENTSRKFYAALTCVVVAAVIIHLPVWLNIILTVISVASIMYRRYMVSLYKDDGEILEDHKLEMMKASNQSPGSRLQFKDFLDRLFDMKRITKCQLEKYMPSEDELINDLEWNQVQMDNIIEELKKEKLIKQLAGLKKGSDHE